MKQFAISVFLLFFRYCLAPHFACPKDRPFLWNTKKCGSFSDICIKYMSDECEFGIRACEQCPLSNFSSTILYQMFRKTYLNEDKNRSQTTNERKPTQECSTNGDQRSILIIVSLLLKLAIPTFVYFIYQFIIPRIIHSGVWQLVGSSKTYGARKKEDHKSTDINLLTFEKQIDSIMKKLEKIEENQYKSIIKSLEEISENQKYFISRGLQEIPGNPHDSITRGLPRKVYAA